MYERNAPAKINLGLHVLRKRPDGYHDIETVFLRIPWADRLTAASADRFSFTCSAPALPTDGRNLCVQAAHRLAEAYGVEARAALHLEKKLPVGAGLGGGSSDAAATLRLLTELWGLSASEERLHSLAVSLGADVPFFLGLRAAYATERGDVLEPLQDPETGAPYRLPFPLVIVAPGVVVSTPEAYQRIKPRAEDRSDLRALVLSNDLARWRTELVNDFEEPVFEAYPAIRAAKEMLKEAGAGYASLSGSGSAVYGVFEEEAPAKAAAEAARREGHRVWHGFVPGESRG